MEAAEDASAGYGGTGCTIEEGFKYHKWCGENGDDAPERMNGMCDVYTREENSCSVEFEVIDTPTMQLSCSVLASKCPCK